MQAVLKRVPVFAMKESNPFRLLSEVLPDCIEFLSEHPDRGASVVATKSQLGQHVLLLGESLSCSAIVDKNQTRLALEDLIQSTKAVMQSFTRVYNIDVRFPPDPWTVHICLAMQDRWTQDHNVAVATALVC